MEWTEVDQIRLNWTELDHMDRIRLNLNGPKWTNLPNKIKVDQVNGPKLNKMDRIKLNWRKVKRMD